MPRFRYNNNEVVEACNAALALSKLMPLKRLQALGHAIDVVCRVYNGTDIIGLRWDDAARAIIKEGRNVPD